MKAMLGLLLAIGAAQGEGLLSLEQATSRTGHDSLAAYEGRTVTVHAQVASEPVWALDTYYLPLRDESDHALLLRGDRAQFSGVSAGDWIQATGTIQSRAGFPMLAISEVHREKPGRVPEPKELSIGELNGFRYLGL